MVWSTELAHSRELRCRAHGIRSGADGVSIGLLTAGSGPALLLLGATSPPWAGDITRAHAATLPAAKLVVLPGQGHEAVDSAPDLVVRELDRFLLDRSLS